MQLKQISIAIAALVAALLSCRGDARVAATEDGGAARTETYEESARLDEELHPPPVDPSLPPGMDDAVDETTTATRATTPEEEETEGETTGT